MQQAGLLYCLLLFLSSTVKLSLSIAAEEYLNGHNSTFFIDGQSDPVEESLALKSTNAQPTAEPYVPDLLDAELDIIYLLDGSYSVGDDFEKTKCLFKNLTAHFDIGYHKVRVGTIQYAYRTRTEFDLRTHQTQAEVLEGLDLAPYRGGKTHTGRALNYVRRHGFALTAGGRLNVPKALILVIDDPSQDSVEGPAKKFLQESNTFATAIGIRRAPQSELRAIAGEASGAFYITNVTDLCALWPKLHKRIKEKLEDMYAVPPDPPSGLNIGVVGRNAVSLKWDRPKGIVTSYIVKYGATDADETDMREVRLQVGREHVTLQGLQTRDHVLQVIAVGNQERSLPVRLEYDTACAGVQVELLVLGDESWSMRPDNFQNFKKFLHSMSNAFLIGSSSGRMGVFLYSSRAPRFVIPLTTYDNRELLQERIDAISFHGGRSSKTGQALDYARQVGFEYARDNAVKVVLLITDGKSADDVEQHAKALRDSGAIIFAVGVSPRHDARELRVIASEPPSMHVLYANGYDDLQKLQPTIVRRICSSVLGALGTLDPPLNPPINVRISSVRDTRFTVSWDRGKGAESVTGYQVRSRGDGRAWKISLTRDSREVEITGLKPGTKYELEVFATGYRKDSSPQMLTVVTTLPGPWNVVASNVSATSAHISWTLTSSYVASFRLIILTRIGETVVINVTHSNATASYDANGLTPGTTYLARVVAFYASEKKSAPSSVQFTTGLAPPDRIYVFNVTSTSATLRWNSVRYEPSHGEESTIRYVTEIIDVAGGLRGTRTVINERVVHFRDLVPGTQYKIRLYVKSGSRRSQPITTTLTTPSISLKLDLAMVVGASPEISNSQLVMLRHFLVTLIKSLQLGRDQIRLGMVQMADPPRVLFDITGIRSQSIFDKIYRMDRRLSPDTYTEEFLIQTLTTVYDFERPKAPKVAIFLNTDNKMTHVVPSIPELRRYGIEPIVIQLGTEHFSSPPGDVERRYALDSFGTLYHFIPYIIRDLQNIVTNFLNNPSTRKPLSLPSNFRAVEVGPSSASLKWDNAGQARFYRVKVSANGQDVKVTTLRGNADGIDLVRLKPGYTYLVTLEGIGEQESDVIELEFKTKGAPTAPSRDIIPETESPTIIPVPRSSEIPTSTAATQTTAAPVTTIPDVTEPGSYDDDDDLLHRVDLVPEFPENYEYNINGEDEFYHDETATRKTETTSRLTTTNTRPLKSLTTRSERREEILLNGEVGKPVEVSTEIPAPLENKDNGRTTQQHSDYEIALNGNVKPVAETPTNTENAGKSGLVTPKQDSEYETISNADTKKTVKPALKIPDQLGNVGKSGHATPEMRNDYEPILNGNAGDSVKAVVEIPTQPEKYDRNQQVTPEFDGIDSDTDTAEADNVAEPRLSPKPPSGVNEDKSTPPARADSATEFDVFSPSDSTSENDDEKIWKFLEHLTRRSHTTKDVTIRSTPVRWTTGSRREQGDQFLSDAPIDDKTERSSHHASAGGYELIRGDELTVDFDKRERATGTKTVTRVIPSFGHSAGEDRSEDKSQVTYDYTFSGIQRDVPIPEEEHVLVDEGRELKLLSGQVYTKPRAIADTKGFRHTTKLMQETTAQRSILRDKSPEAATSEENVFDSKDFYGELPRSSSSQGFEFLGGEGKEISDRLPEEEFRDIVDNVYLQEVTPSSIYFTWTPVRKTPSLNGYKIKFTPYGFDGEPATERERELDTGAGSDRIVLDGLIRDTRYEIEIYSVYEGGDLQGPKIFVVKTKNGDLSQQRPRIFSAPEIIMAKSISPTQISISWSYDAADSNLLYFRITYRPTLKLDGISHERQTDATRNRFVMQDLTPGTEYSIQISAVHIHNGRSNPARVTVSTMPILPLNGYGDAYPRRNDLLPTRFPQGVVRYATRVGTGDESYSFVDEKINGFKPIPSEPVSIDNVKEPTRPTTVLSDGSRKLKAEIVSGNSLKISWQRWSKSGNTTTDAPPDVEYVVAFTPKWPLGGYNGEVKARDDESIIIIPDMPYDSRYRVDLYEETGYSFGVVDSLEIDIPPSPTETLLGFEPINATEATDNVNLVILPSKLHPPVNFHLVWARPTSLRLAWSHGETGTTYQLQYYDVSYPRGIRQVSTVADYVTLRDLLPGHTYHAALIANRNGTHSDPVSPNEVLTTTIPQPANLTIRFTKVGRLIMTWDKPKEADIREYKVYYAKSPSTQQTFFKVTETRAEIPGFHPGQYYWVSVTSVIGYLESEANVRNGYAKLEADGDDDEFDVIGGTTTQGSTADVNAGNTGIEDGEGSDIAGPSTDDDFVNGGYVPDSTKDLDNVGVDDIPPTPAVDTGLRTDTVPTVQAGNTYQPHSESDRTSSVEVPDTNSILDISDVTDRSATFVWKRYPTAIGSRIRYILHIAPVQADGTVGKARTKVQPVGSQRYRASWLTPATTYQVTLQAKISPPQREIDLSKKMFRTKLTAPDLKQISVVGTNSARLGWTKQKFPFTYEVAVVEDEPSSDPKAIVWATSVPKASVTRDIVIEDLTPGTRYVANVTAHYRGASSEPSQIRFITKSVDRDNDSIDGHPGTAGRGTQTRTVDPTAEDKEEISGGEQPTDSEEEPTERDGEPTVEDREGIDDGTPADPSDRIDDSHGDRTPPYTDVKLTSTDQSKTDFSTKPSGTDRDETYKMNENAKLPYDTTAKPESDTTYKPFSEDDQTLAMGVTETNVFLEIGGVTHRSATISWKSYPTAIGSRIRYILYIAPVDTDGTVGKARIKHTPVGALQYTPTWLNPATTYQVVLEGNMSPSGKEIILSRKRFRTKLPAPDLKDILFTGTESARIGWKKQKFPFTYEIAVKEDEISSDPEDVIFSSSVEKASVTRDALVEGLTPGTRYLAKVTTHYHGEKSTPAQIRFITRPKPPYGFKVDQVEGQRYRLTWSHPTGRRSGYIADFSVIQNRRLDRKFALGADDSTLIVDVPDRSKAVVRLVTVRETARSRRVKVSFRRRDDSNDLDVEEILEEEKDAEPTDSGEKVTDRPTVLDKTRGSTPGSTQSKDLNGDADSESVPTDRYGDRQPTESSEPQTDRGRKMSEDHGQQIIGGETTDSDILPTGSATKPTTDEGAPTTDYETSTEEGKTPTDSDKRPTDIDINPTPDDNRMPDEVDNEKQSGRTPADSKKQPSGGNETQTTDGMSPPGDSKIPGPSIAVTGKPVDEGDVLTNSKTNPSRVQPLGGSATATVVPFLIDPDPGYTTIPDYSGKETTGQDQEAGFTVTRPPSGWLTISRRPHEDHYTISWRPYDIPANRRVRYMLYIAPVDKKGRVGRARTKYIPKGSHEFKTPLKPAHTYEITLIGKITPPGKDVLIDKMTIQTGVPAPVLKSLSFGSVRTNSVQIEWRKIKYPFAYEVEVFEDEPSSDPQAVIASSIMTNADVTRFATIEGLTPGTRYMAKVTATYRDERSEAAQMPFTTRPKPPHNFKVQHVSGDRYTMSWLHPAGRRDGYVANYWVLHDHTTNRTIELGPDDNAGIVELPEGSKGVARFYAFRDNSKSRRVKVSLRHQVKTKVPDVEEVLDKYPEPRDQDREKDGEEDDKERYQPDQGRKPNDRDRTTTDGSRKPGDRDRTPTVGTKAPHDRDRTPTDGSRKPGDRDRTQTDGSREPGDRDRTPTDGSRKPGDRDRTPTDGSREPDDRDRTPTDGGRKPGDRNRTQTDGSREPGDRDRTPTDRSRKPGDRDRTPTDGSREPDDRDRTPTDGGRKLGDRDRTPTDGGREPDDRERTPTDRGRKPGDRDRTPTDGGREPDDRDRTPTDGTPVPGDHDRTPTDGSRELDDREPDDRDRNSVDGTRAPDDHDRAPTDGSSKPDDRDRTPTDGSRKPGDRDRTPTDGGREPDDRERTPTDRGRKPGDRDRTPTDGGREPDDRDRTPTDGGREPDDRDQTPTDGGREPKDDRGRTPTDGSRKPGDRDRTPTDGSSKPGDRDRTPTDGSREPDDRDRTPTDGGRKPGDRNRTQTDGSREPGDRDRTPTDGSREPGDRDRTPTDGSREPDDRDRTPTDGGRKPGDRDRTPTDGDREPDDLDRIPTDGSHKPSDRDRTPTDVTKAPDDRDRAATDGDREPDDRDRTPTDGSRKPGDRDRTPIDGGREPDDRDRTSIDGTRKPDDHDRTATDGSSKPDDRDRTPTDGSRKPGDRDRAPTDGRREPDDRERTPTDGGRKPDDRDRTPTDGGREPDDRDRTSTGGSRKPGDRDRTPTDGSREPDGRDRTPTDGSRKPGDRDRTQTDGTKAPDDRDRTPTDGGREPDNRDRTPNDGGREPDDRNRTPTDGSRKPGDRDRTPADGGREPDDRERTPTDGGRKPGDRDRTPTDGGREPDDRDRTPTDGTPVPGDHDRTPTDGSRELDDREPDDRDRAPTDGSSKPDDRDRTPTDGSRKPGDRDRTPTDGGREPDDRDRTPTDGSRKPGDRDRTPTDGTKAPDDRDRSPTDGGREPDDRERTPTDRGRKPGDRDRTPTDGGREPDDRDRTPTDGGREPDDRDRTPVDGGREPDDRERTPTDGSRKPGDRDRTPNDGGREPDGRDRTPTDGSRKPGDREPDDPDRYSIDGTRAPDEHDRTPTDGSSKPDDRDRTPADGSREPGDRDRTPTDGGREPDDRERTPTDGRKPGDRDRTPTDGGREPDDRDRTPTDGGRKPGDRDRTPIDGGREPDDRDRTPTDGSRKPGDRDRTPTDGGREPDDRERTPTDRGRKPGDRDRTPTDGGREPDDRDRTPTDGTPVPGDHDRTPTDGSRELDDREPDDRDRNSVDGTRAPDDHDRAPTDGSSKPDDRDRTPTDGSRKPGDRDRTPTDGGREPDDRERTPTDRGRKPGDRDRTPTDGGREPDDRDRTPTDGSRKPGDRDRTPTDGTKAPDDRDRSPTDGGREPDDRERTPTDRGRKPGDRDRTPTDGGREPDDRDRTPTDGGREPDDRDRTPIDGGREPDDRERTPTDGSRKPGDRDRTPNDGGREPDGRDRTPTDGSRKPGDREPDDPDRDSIDGTRAPDDHDRTPTDGSSKQDDRDRTPTDGSREPGNRDRTPTDGGREPDDRERTPTDGRKPGDRDRTPTDGGREPDDRDRTPTDGGRKPGDRDRPPIDGGREPDDRDRTPTDGSRKPGDRDRTPIDGGREPNDRDRTPIDGGREPDDRERTLTDGSREPGDREPDDPDRDLIDGTRAPDDHERTPTDGSSKPNDRDRTPADGGREPDDRDGTPIHGGRKPGDRDRTPTGGGREPVDRDLTPTDGSRKPVDRDRTPIDGGRDSDDRDRTPIDGGREPDDRDRTSIDGTRAPDDHDRTATDGSSKPDHRDRTPVDGSRKPGDRDRAPTDGGREPDDRDRTPIDGTQAPGDRDRTPTDGSREPGDREPGDRDRNSIDGTRAPDDHDRTQTDGSSKPDDRDRTSTDESRKPDDRDRTTTDGGREPDDRDRAPIDGTRAPDDHDRTATDGSSKPDHRDRTPVDGSRKPGDRDRTPTDGGREPDDRDRTPIDGTQAPGDRDRTPTDGGREPDDRDRIPIHGGRKSGDRDRTPADGGREPDDRDRTSADRTEAPDDRDRTPSDGGREPDDREQTPADGGRKPGDRDRTPTDGGREPDDRDRTPIDGGRKPGDRDRTPTDGGREPDDRERTPADGGRKPGDRDRTPTDGGREPDDRDRTSTDGGRKTLTNGSKPDDRDRTPTDGGREPDDRDRTPIHGGRKPGDRDRTPIDGGREPDDRDRAPIDGTRAPDDHNRTATDGSSKPDHRDRTPVDGSRKPGDRDRTPTDGGREPDDRDRTPIDGTQAPGDRDRTPTDESREPGDREPNDHDRASADGSSKPDDRDRTSTDGSRKPGYHDRTPIDGSREPDDRDRTPIDGSREPDDRDRTPYDGGREPGYRDRTPTDGSREPDDRDRTPYDGGREPGYRDRTPTDGSREPDDRDRTPTDGGREPEVRERTPTDGSRDPGDRNRTQIDGARGQGDRGQTPTDGSLKPVDRDRTPIDGTRAPDDRDRTRTDEGRWPDDRDRTATGDKKKLRPKSSRDRKPSCDSGKTDLVFIVDSSASISPGDYSILREWLQNLLEAFDVAGDGTPGAETKTYVSIVQYGTEPAVGVLLGDYSSRDGLSEAIGTLEQIGGSSTTGRAINFAKSTIFDAKDRRPDATKIAVVLTNGASRDDAVAAATEMKEAGVRLFAFGVGDVSVDELSDIASKPKAKFVFNVSDYTELEDLRKKFQWALCREARKKGGRPRDRGDRRKEKKCNCRPGLDGRPGTPGAQGPTGMKGERGERGLVGATGERGLPGVAGDRGSVGPRGPPGLPGVSRPSRIELRENDKTFNIDDENDPLARALRELAAEEVSKTGPKGEKGSKGSTGAPGIVGPKGALGPVGPHGPDGRSGRPGSSGSRGVRGFMGPQGLPGRRGLEGRIGPKGAKGDSSSEEYITSIARQVCQAMLIEHERLSHSGGRAVAYGIETSSGVVIQRGLPGPPGDRGSSGPPGPPGYEGPRGLRGYRGMQGYKGSRGQKGDIGDRGPRGIPGVGVPGPQGRNGPPGAPGRAVQGLPGERGEKGDLGPIGPQGYRGQKGERGVCDSFHCTGGESRQRRDADSKDETESRIGSLRDPKARAWWPWN